MRNESSAFAIFLDTAISERATTATLLIFPHPKFKPALKITSTILKQRGYAFQTFTSLTNRFSAFCSASSGTEGYSVLISSEIVSI